MAVFGLVSAVAGFVKVRYLADKATINNFVFRAHYRITSAILFVSCIIVTANNLIGDPINCIDKGVGIPENVLNTYCWISSTFTLPHQQGKPVGSHVAYPGVGTYNHQTHETQYHAYYQWVPFVLFLQGILFYIPHWLWKNMEEGKVAALTEGIRGSAVISSSPEERRQRQSRLVQYILQSIHQHQSYAAGYFFCEVLNLVNAIGNIYLIDKLLGGTFLTYGTEVINFASQDQENRTDPMVVIFPRLTKCTFHKYGPSGTIQRHDTLCVLALNILNEKIYIFLWFWIIFLSVISGLAIIYSLILIISPMARGSSLRRRFVKFHFGRSRSGRRKVDGSMASLTPSSRAGTPPLLDEFVIRSSVGDFLLLHFISSNVNGIVYRELMEELCQEMGLQNNIYPSIPSPSTLELKPISSKTFG